jgi:hypothetical protein
MAKGICPIFALRAPVEGESYMLTSSAATPRHTLPPLHAGVDRPGRPSSWVCVDLLPFFSFLYFSFFPCLLSYLLLIFPFIAF